MAGKTLDQEIKELLTLTAEHSDQDQTVWMDLYSIAWVLTHDDDARVRIQIKKRLVQMQRQGQVESRVFEGIRGWRLKKRGR